MMSASVLVDTNLLLLAIVGGLRPDLIGNHRRLKEFRRQDASILRHELNKFRKFVTVPNILTEASNFIGAGDQEICDGASERLAEYILTTEEMFMASKESAKFPEFFRLGLTDTALLRIARKRIVVITADFPLASRLQKLQLPCINFNHLRTPQ